MFEKDKKLLYELDVDGFQTTTQLAKKLKQSKQTTSYQLKQLMNKRILRRVYPIYGLERLGFEGKKIFFQMRGITKKVEKEITKYFTTQKEIVWIGIYEGRFDFVISTFTKNIHEFERLFERILNNIGDYVEDYDIVQYTTVIALKKKYFSKKVEPIKESAFATHSNIAEIDDTDKEILRLLSKNARQSKKSIAEKMKLSIDTITNRIKKLKQKNIIQGSRILIDKNKLQIDENKLLLKLKRFDGTVHKKLHVYAQQHKNIVAYIRCVGPWNVELDIELLPTQKFHDFLLEFKTAFSEEIQNIESLKLYDEFKYNFAVF